MDVPLYIVDVNGHKKPNKWGYDIFVFDLRGNLSAGIKRINGVDFATEQGGTLSTTMIQKLFSE